jgi:hypothetical protein
MDVLLSKFVVHRVALDFLLQDWEFLAQAWDNELSGRYDHTTSHQQGITAERHFLQKDIGPFAVSRIACAWRVVDVAVPKWKMAALIQALTSSSCCMPKIVNKPPPLCMVKFQLFPPLLPVFHSSRQTVWK